MKRYGARVHKDGRWWMVHIPAVSGLTQARRLSEAELMAREFVALRLDIPLEEVAVDVIVTRVGNVDVSACLHQIADDRQAVRQAAQRVEEDVRALAAALRDEHVTVRDIGAVLGVSHQRVSQILAAPANTQPTSPAHGT